MQILVDCRKSLLICTMVVKCTLQSFCPFNLGSQTTLFSNKQYGLVFGNGRYHFCFVIAFFAGHMYIVGNVHSRWCLVTSWWYLELDLAMYRSSRTIRAVVTTGKLLCIFKCVMKCCLVLCTHSKNEFFWLCENGYSSSNWFSHFKNWLKSQLLVKAVDILDTKPNDIPPLCFLQRGVKGLKRSEH